MHVPELRLDPVGELAVANDRDVAPAGCLSVARNLMKPLATSLTSVEAHGELEPIHWESSWPSIPITNQTRRAHKQQNVRTEMA